MKIRSLLFAVSCSLVAPAAAPAFADDIGGEVTITAPGEAVASVDVFYDRLSPYGVWTDDADLGRVFIPDTEGYVPYRDGHWQYTDAGFVWISDEPHAWATSHYGRWGYSPAYARWVWAPDLTWGPAWVDWSQSGDDFGWAPMQPAVYVGYGFEPPVDGWRFCPSAHVLDVTVVNYYEPRERIVELHTRSQRLDHYATVGGARLAVGPAAATLREHNVTVKPVKLDIKVAGRFTATEQKTMVEHARVNHDAVEKRNTERVQANVKVREVATKVKAKAPEVGARAAVKTTTEPKKTEPAKTEPKATPKTEPKAEPKAEPKKTTTEPKARTETKTEPPKSEPPKSEPKKATEPKETEARKTEPAKTEPVKTAPKTETPKATPEKKPPAEPKKAPPHDDDKPRS